MDIDIKKTPPLQEDFDKEKSILIKRKENIKTKLIYFPLLLIILNFIFAVCFVGADIQNETYRTIGYSLIVPLLFSTAIYISIKSSDLFNDIEVVNFNIDLMDVYQDDLLDGKNSLFDMVVDYNTIALVDAYQDDLLDGKNSLFDMVVDYNTIANYTLNVGKQGRKIKNIEYLKFVQFVKEEERKKEELKCVSRKSSNNLAIYGVEFT